jgi:hypothetical protein
MPPSGRVNAPLSPGASVRAADAYRAPLAGGTLPGIRGVPGSRSGGSGSGSGGNGGPLCRGATGRLFDATGRQRGFFDPSLRQGY